MKMKSYLFIGLMFFVALSACGQSDMSKKPSPPASASGNVGEAKVTIDYSQPAVKGRTIWGDLVPYDKVWRTGANEATTLTVSKDVKVNGEDLAAGKYSLFTIPGEKKWIVILNSESDQWGAYKYDLKKDVMRFEVTPGKAQKTERLTFMVSDSGEIKMMWDELMISFNIE